MKKLIFFLLITSLFACNEDDYKLGPSATVNLNIHATFNDEPLVIGKAYTFPDGNKIKFDDFSFFVSKVVLHESETTDELDLLEVGLADFSGNTDPNLVEPATFAIRSVPGTSYQRVDVSIGVQSKFNKESILDYGIGHPVRQAYDTHFWPEKGSFFFMKMAGVYDLNNDGVFTGLPEDHPFEHFTFGNDNYTTLTFNHNFTVQDNQPFNLDLTIDLAKLYIEPSTLKPIDMENTDNLSTYDPENDALDAFFMNNFVRALKIK